MNTKNTNRTTRGSHLASVTAEKIIKEAVSLARPDWRRTSTWLVRKVLRLIDGSVEVQFDEVANARGAWEDVKSLAALAGVVINGKQWGYGYYGGHTPTPRHKRVAAALRSALSELRAAADYYQ